METKEKATSQKVTLYLSPELHRRLKVQAAVEVDSMSAIAERAVEFYLTNPDVVEANSHSHGQTHRIYSCPACSTSVVLQQGEMVALSSRVGGRSSILSDSTDDLSVCELPVSSSGGATVSMVNGTATPGNMAPSAANVCTVSSGSGSSESSLCSDGDGLQRDSEQLVPC
jgi:hypothetical protein